MINRRAPLRAVTVVDGAPEFRSALETGDIEVEDAGSHGDALAAIEAAPTHCVVVSAAHEACDPIELCTAVRDRDPELPVVLALDGSLGDLGEAAIEAGVSATGRIGDPQALAETVLDEATTFRESTGERQRTRTDAQILEALLSSLPLSIYVKDDRHRHVRVSEAMICGPDSEEYIENDEGKAHQHPDDLLGKTDFDIFGAGGEAAIEDDETVMETEEPIENRIEQTLTSLGEEAFYSTSKAPWYDAEGEVVGVLGVTGDVTERERYRRNLEQQNERLEEFASMVSHDLRNPLTVLAGYLEVLEDGHDETALEHCRDSVERMEELIEEILAYARHGRAVIDPDLVDLEAVARAAWENVDTGEATLTVDVAHPVRADRPRLQRVLENCFRNSIEHAGEGVVVTVGDDGTDFFVGDDGPGIEPERREAVFERGVTSQEGGTGFGLATVKTIAEAHGWTVGIEDCPEGGTRVHFSGVARADQH